MPFAWFMPSQTKPAGFIQTAGRLRIVKQFGQGPGDSLSIELLVLCFKHLCILSANEVATTPKLYGYRNSLSTTALIDE